MLRFHHVGQAGAAAPDAKVVGPDRLSLKQINTREFVKSAGVDRVWRKKWTEMARRFFHDVEENAAKSVTKAWNRMQKYTVKKQDTTARRITIDHNLFMVLIKFLLGASEANLLWMCGKCIL